MTTDEMANAACIVVLTLASLPTVAHHSIGTYDTAQTVVLNGTLRRAQIINPHALFWVTARNAAGDEQRWLIEGAGAASVMREVRGGSRNYFAPGQPVTVTLRPSRDGRPVGFLLSMQFADGRVLNGIRIP